MAEEHPPGWWRAGDGHWYGPDQHPRSVAARIRAERIATVEAPGISRGGTVYRWIVIVGGVLLFVSPFLPWVSFVTASPTFFAVDAFWIFPVGILVASVTGIVFAVIRPRKIVDTGLRLGLVTFVLGAIGFTVALADAKVIEQTAISDRIRIYIATGPSFGGVLALLVDAVLIIGASSQWRAVRKIPWAERSHAVIADATLLVVPAEVNDEGRPIFDEKVVTGPEFGGVAPLPHIDAVLGPAPAGPEQIGPGDDATSGVEGPPGLL